MKLGSGLVVLGLCGIFLGVNSASARTVSISGHHSKKDIADHCKAINGQFDTMPNGNYSCVNPSNGNAQA